MPMLAEGNLGCCCWLRKTWGAVAGQKQISWLQPSKKILGYNLFLSLFFYNLSFISAGSVSVIGLFVLSLPNTDQYVELKIAWASRLPLLWNAACRRSSKVQPIDCTME